MVQRSKTERGERSGGLAAHAPGSRASRRSRRAAWPAGLSRQRPPCRPDKRSIAGFSDASTVEASYRFISAQPVPGPHHATLLSAYDMLLRSAQECMPVTIRPTGGTTVFESWEITRAAFIARMASTLRHLGYLAPSFSRLDGAALARTLIEHAITYAWIAGAPGERLPRFIRKNFSDQLKKDQRRRQTDELLIGDEFRAQMRAYVRLHTDDMPGLPRLAKEADDSWVERSRATWPQGMQIPGFVDLYDDVYDGFAALDHASTVGLQWLVHRHDDPTTVVTVDGDPQQELDTALRPYWLATWAFAMALLVSSLHAGRPRSGPLQRTLRVIGGLREHEAEGRLKITPLEGGGWSLDLASA